ncbi:MAG: transcriptional regulator [Phycisphaerae bacterium]|nr:transcriptional regulator [Phycisphaerae bacterium]NIX29155.1 ArsR family transcriptional regulator [Phycisphaerae bacterium]
MAKQGMLEELQMPKSRRLILLALKEQGGKTADELAVLLKISAVAVRRHLDNLKHAELIKYEEVQQGMGRPKFVYSLTEKAEHIFPRNYEELAHDILDTIRELYGQEAVDAIFAKRYQKIKETYTAQINAETLQERLDQLTKLRRTDGYMADWTVGENGTFILTELNCPIQHVAEGCCQACEQDLKLFNELLDAEVTRQDHLIQGDQACSYAIIPKE